MDKFIYEKTDYFPSKTTWDWSWRSTSHGVDPANHPSVNSNSCFPLENFYGRRNAGVDIANH